MDFRTDDEHRRVTVGGYIATALIVLLTTTALGLQELEALQEERAAAAASEQRQEELLAAARRSEAMLTQVRRGLYPLDELTIDLTVNLPNDAQVTRSYFEATSDRLERLNPAPRTVPDGISMVSGTGNAMSYEFASDSRFAPNWEQNPGIASALNTISVEIEFFRASPGPFRLDDIKHSHPSRAPDLRMFEATEWSKYDLQRDVLGPSHSMRYSVEENQFSKKIRAHTLRRELWRSNGRIVSFVDLAGSEMHISVDSGPGTFDHELNRQLDEFDKKLRLEWIRLTRRGITFDTRRLGLKTHEDERGMPCFVVRFPDTVDDLLNW